MQKISAIIDTQKISHKNIGRINAGDDTVLELEIRMNDEPLQFNNPVFTYIYKKSDGNYGRQERDITIVDGKVVIRLEEQAVTCTGIVSGQLFIVDNGKTSTCIFNFQVGKSFDREIIQSISNVEVLKELDEYVATAFENLTEYEERLNKLANDMYVTNDVINTNEEHRKESEDERKTTFDELVERMSNVINSAIETDEIIGNNETNRINNYNTIKNDLEQVRTSLINLNDSLSLEEQKRVQAEINRVNEAIEIMRKLDTLNTDLTNAETLRVQEWNTVKSENTSLKEALTAINNTANSNEEVRKSNETSRVSAEATRVTEFNKIKQDNSTLNTSLTKKVDDKIKEIQSTTDTFKENINTSFNELSNEQQNNFEALREEVLSDIEASYVGYDNEQHHNLESRLNSDFDKINQRVNDSSYLEYEGTSIKADNTYYGLTKDTTVKGRTLQNLLTEGMFDGDERGWNTTLNSTDYSFAGGYVTINSKSGSYVNLYSKVNGMFKPSSVYTVLLDVKENTLEGKADYKFAVTSGSSIFNETISKDMYSTKGVHLIKLTTKDDISGTSNILRSFIYNSVTSGLITFKYMILEGDHTNTPIEELPFVEGIQSVGENEVQENGSYLISGKSCGKNLIDVNNLIYGYYYDASTGEIKKNTYSSCSEYIKYNKRDIFISGLYNQVSNYVGYYDINYNFIGRTSANPVTEFKLTVGSAIADSSYRGNVVPANAEYLALNMYKKGSINDNVTIDMIKENIKHLQLEENSQPTSFQPYQESTYSYILNEPLRQLPNGVADSINLETGVLTRRVGKIVFDGVTNKLGTVSSITNTLENVACFNCLIKNSLANFGERAYCTFSHYEGGNGDYEHWRTSYQNVDGDTTNRIGSFYVFIDRSKLSALTNEGINEWLQSNPITVYYPLKEEITEQLEPTQLKSFEGTTHIVSNSTLQARTSVKIPSNVQAVVTNLINENEALRSNVDILNVENEGLKETNEVQDELIDINMMATDEVYTMIEPLLASQPQIMSMERGVSKLVDMYVAMVQRGLKTIDQVPVRYRAEVQAILEALEK